MELTNLCMKISFNLHILSSRYFPTGSGDNISIISIPSNLFGEYIKPGSFEFKYLQDTSIVTLTDNGEGKIVSGSQKVGDIIYGQGNIILTDSDSISHSSVTNIRNLTCSFQSTMTIYESQYKCTFSPNEYTYTQNPSAISGSSNSGIVYDFLTGSYFQPYVTTVGLYNNANQLVAVGKLSQPLQSSNITDTTILVNLDL